MPLAHYITSAEKKWFSRIYQDHTPWPNRDNCLANFFWGTPCTILELNRIQIKDVLTKSGKIAKRFELDKLDFKGNKRYVELKNKKLRDSLKCYVDSIGACGLNLGETKQHIGLDPNANLFITLEGKPFSLTKANGKFKPDSLKRHIFSILKEAGIEEPGTDSGRRTFAINAQREGIDFTHIHHLLGNKAKRTTRRLLMSDPEKMGSITARAF